MKTKPSPRDPTPSHRRLADAQREERIWFGKLVQAKDAAEEARQRWIEACQKAREVEEGR